MLHSGSSRSAPPASARIRRALDDGEELTERLTEARRSARRETAWLAFGVTPATILPAGLAAAHGHGVLALALVTGGFLIQGMRWLRSARRVKALQAELDEARALDDEAGAGGAAVGTDLPRGGRSEDGHG